ncbi:MAG: hemerythrin family protein [Methylococcales bacterium]|jgi:hemerythrin|nr:hemerythrin family protein [Methylococcales bacterium]MBT7408755.1 hemerythrin family protein [Methylococcales bacterium]
MEWKKEYATGVDQIDEQHKMLFKMSSDFKAALNENVGERTYGMFLKYLTSYCKSHFRYEEKCMDDHKCPVAKQNKTSHKMFLEKVTEFHQRYDTHHFLQEDANELVKIIDSWLDGHIINVDIHLKKRIKNK